MQMENEIEFHLLRLTVVRDNDCLICSGALAPSHSRCNTNTDVHKLNDTIRMTSQSALK